MNGGTSTSWSTRWPAGTRSSCDSPLSYLQAVRLMEGTLQWKEMTEELLSVERRPVPGAGEGTTVSPHTLHGAQGRAAGLSRETRPSGPWPRVLPATLGSLGQLRAKSVYFLIQNVPVMPPGAEGSGRAPPGAAPAVSRGCEQGGVCGGSGGAAPRYRQRDPPDHGHNGRPRTRLRFLRLFRGSGGTLGVTGWPGGSAAAPSPPGGAPGAAPPPPPPASIAAAPGAAPLPWRPAAPNTRGGGAIAAPSSHRP